MRVLTMNPDLGVDIRMKIAAPSQTVYSAMTDAETDGITTLHVRQGNFENSAQRDGHQQGWQGGSDQLKSLLEAQS